LYIDVIIYDRNHVITNEFHHVITGVGTCSYCSSSNIDGEQSINFNGIKITTNEDVDPIITQKNRIYGKEWPVIDNHTEALKRVVENFFESLSYDLFPI
jgi:hypothetical protein